MKTKNFNRRDFFGSLAGSFAIFTPLLIDTHQSGQEKLPSSNDFHDYVIYKNDGLTIAKDRYENQFLFSDKNSSNVFNNLLSSIGSQGGGEILIGSGVYDIDEPILLPSLVSFRGGGRNTILKLSPTNEQGIILKISSSESSIISDLTSGARHMPKYDTEAIRNVALLGAAGAGKTTIVEAMLHDAGAIGRHGSDRGRAVGFVGLW